jgi:Flp pilus assembly protein CpaB
MFSRIAAFVAALAIVAAGSLAFTASAQTSTAHADAKQPVRVIQLERVVITAKRLNADAR